MLTVVLSPYHLTSREPAAMATLLLAGEVVTHAPTAIGAAYATSSVARVQSSPGFVRLMESWSWSMPLWHAGVIDSCWQGEHAGPDVAAASAMVESGAGFDDLKPFMHTPPPADEIAMLDAIARDVLRAGPDPAIAVPVAAGLDLFASRLGLTVARAAGDSIAQRAESRLAKPVFAAAVPVLLQASAERILEARLTLADELAALRGAMDEALAPSANGFADQPDPNAQQEVRAAADQLSAAFDRERDDLLRPEADEDDPRVIGGLASITGAALPADAVLRSSLSAARRVQGTSPAHSAADSPAPKVRSLLIRAMGRTNRP